MSSISQQIKSIEDIEIPEDLHNKIMQKALFLKFKKPIIFIVFLMLIDLSAHAWHIVNRLIEVNMPQIALNHLINLDFTFSIANLFLFIRPIILISFIINIVVIGYITLFYLSSRQKGVQRILPYNILKLIPYKK
ncbi:MAG: hypothetical protein PHI53_00665 [Candidatus Pacebacteria bacterium]|nr:hypothetical protein [Candidatus Paceibacterota bacterium]